MHTKDVSISRSATLLAFLSVPMIAGAAALNVSGPLAGELNGGNLSVSVSGNGVTTGCINFYNSSTPDSCSATASGNTFVVVAPSDPNDFTFHATGTINDIPAPPVPAAKFMTVPGPAGTVNFDLTAVSVPNQVACQPGGVNQTCAIGDFTFTQYNCNNGNCSILVGFVLNANAYTGTIATGYTPYSINFSTQFTPGSLGPQTNLSTLFSILATAGSIQASASFTAKPSGANVGALCSVTQGGWGAPPHGNNAGAFLVAHFPTAGVTIGVVSLTPPPYDLHFTSPQAVQSFLPQGGAPGVLNASAVNPTTSSAGVFAGQVLALELNVTLEGIGGLTLSGTGTSLDGKTVSQVLAIANQVLSGNLAALPSGYTVSSLNDLIDSLNSSFDGCVANSFAAVHFI